MLHLHKSDVFIRGGGWGTRPPLSEFSGSAPGPQTKNWKNESLNMRSTVFCFEKRNWVETIAWLIVVNRKTTKLVIIFFSVFNWQSSFRCCSQEPYTLKKLMRTASKLSVTAEKHRFFVRARWKPRSARQRPKQPGLNFANAAYFLQAKTRKTKHRHLLNRPFLAKTAMTHRMLVEK